MSSPHFEFRVGFCLHSCGVSGPGLFSEPSLPLDTYQSVRSRGRVVHGCAETTKCQNCRGKSPGTIPAISLIQMHLYMEAIDMRIFISMFSRQQTYLQFSCARIFFESSVSIAVCTW